MIEKLEKDLKELKETVEKITESIPKVQENKVDKDFSKQTWIKYFGNIIAVGALIASGVAGWTTLKSAVKINSDNIANQERIVEKHSAEIENVKLQTVIGTQDIKHIKETVEKMDVKLDKLLEAK